MVKTSKYKVTAKNKRTEDFLLGMLSTKGAFKETIASRDPLVIHYRLKRIRMFPSLNKQIKPRDLILRFTDHMEELKFKKGRDFVAEELIE